MKTTLETTTITTTIRVSANSLPALAVAHMIAYGLALRGVAASVCYGVGANERRDGTLEVSGLFHGLGDRERFNGLFLECATAAMQAIDLARNVGLGFGQVQS